MKILLLFAWFALVLSVAVVALIDLYMPPPEQRLPEYEVWRNKIEIDIKLQGLTNKLQFLFTLLWSTFKDCTLQWGAFIDDVIEDVVAHIS